MIEVHFDNEMSTCAVLVFTAKAGAFSISTEPTSTIGPGYFGVKRALAIFCLVDTAKN